MAAQMVEMERWLHAAERFALGLVTQGWGRAPADKAVSGGAQKIRERRFPQTKEYRAKKVLFP